MLPCSMFFSVTEKPTALAASRMRIISAASRALVRCDTEGADAFQTFSTWLGAEWASSIWPDEEESAGNRVPMGRLTDEICVLGIVAMMTMSAPSTSTQEIVSRVFSLRMRICG